MHIMANKPSLNKLFAALHEKLACELGITRKTVLHAGTMGSVSEGQWIEMLYKHLPKRYKVNRAFVIDSRGGCSEQMDIVIHDRQYSPFVLNYGEALYVPAESVYAVFEVKQAMSAKQVRYAGKKIRSVRKLCRTSIAIHQADRVSPPKPLHRILGGLLTVESEWDPPFGSAFEKAISALPEQHRLDIGCSAKHGVFEASYPNTGACTIARGESEAPLALFLLRLIDHLRTIATVPAIDICAYASKIQKN